MTAHALSFIERFGLRGRPARVAPDAQPVQLYRIWSLEHNRWWGPNGVGYIEAQYPQLAGLYNHAEAMDICTKANYHNDRQPMEAMVPV